MGTELDYTALGQYLRKAENMQFKYGVHDCVTFSNECVKALLGIDALAQTPIGRYKDAAWAYAQIKGDMRNFVRQLRCGHVPHRVLDCDEPLRCGDMLVAQIGPHAPLCVCVGEYIYTVGLQGIVKIKVADAAIIEAVRFRSN